MPDINLSGILSTFLSSAANDGSVTKGLISQPEATVEKATGASLGGINLKSLIPIAIGILVAYAMSSGQAKTEKAAEKKVEAGTLDLSDMNVGSLLGNLDLGSLLGLGGTAAAATATATAAPAAAAETTASAGALDGITDAITEQLKQSVVESLTSQLLGGTTTKSTKKQASSDSGIVGDLLGGVVSSLLSGKK